MVWGEIGWGIVRCRSCIYEAHLFGSSKCGFDHLKAGASLRRHSVTRYEAPWIAFARIKEDRRLEFRAVAQNRVEGQSAAWAETAFDKHRANVLDEFRSWVRFPENCRSRNVELRVTVWRFGW